MLLRFNTLLKKEIKMMKTQSYDEKQQKKPKTYM